MDRRIGAQYFTLREHIQTLEGFEDACRKVREIGYEIVQVSGTPLKAADMKPILDKYGLKTVVTHRNFNDFLADVDEIIDYNKTLGCEVCGIGIMPPEYTTSSEKITEFIRKANQIAAKIKTAGLKFAYHNHALEFGKFEDGVCIFDRLLDETNPDEFFFIVDTFWIQAGGANPVHVIKKIGKRAAAVHFKDFTVKISDWQKPLMAEVGCGNLEWDAIIEACDEAGIPWALVEQDICQRDPFDCLKASYDYLKTKGFY